MNGIHRTLLALGATLVGGTMLTATAFAWSGDTQGRPDNLRPGGDEGYYVWHDDSGLHVYTTDPAGHHKYAFRIRTDGVFQNVDPVRLDGRDRVEVLDGGHLMVGDFFTHEGIDGVNFNIAGGTRMHLALSQDGSLIDKDLIYLGDDASHPASNPFVELR